MRPGSPKRLLSTSENGSERPHTISTAYEKGHQRPQLQPYTFSPPESTLTIHEMEDDENGLRNNINNINSNNKKPPVPKRIGQLSGDRPIVPNKTLAATMAAVKQQQLQQNQMQRGEQGGHLPSFTMNKNDMGKFIFLCYTLTFLENVRKMG